MQHWCATRPLQFVTVTDRGDLTAPDTPGPQRDLENIQDPYTYNPRDPVWVYTGDRWHPGFVEAVVGMALIVRWAPSGGPERTDAVTAPYVAPRTGSRS